MPRYKPYDYKQSKLVAVDYEAQLAPGTFEHAMRRSVEIFLPKTMGRCSAPNQSFSRTPESLAPLRGQSLAGAGYFNRYAI